MFGLIAALAFGLVTAQTESVGGSEEEVYSVSAFIYENGDLIGAPTLTVRHGRPGSARVAGERGYGLEITINDASPADAEAFQLESVGTRLRADARVFLPAGNEWSELARPTFLAERGVRATAAIDTYAQSFRRSTTDDYIEQLAVELVIVEVDESWLSSNGGAKTLSDCAFDGESSPKLLGASALSAARNDCCNTGCTRCYGGCCSDSANCRAGCCP